MATSGSQGGSSFPVLRGVILEEELTPGISLEELCRACSAEADFVAELVDEELLLPRGTVRADWRFTGLQLRHARVAVRLRRDLGVNAAGAALALQLLEEIEVLRARLRGMGGAEAR